MNKLVELASSRRLWGTVASLGATAWAYYQGIIPAEAFVEGMQGILKVYVGSVAAEHFAAGLAALRKG